MTGHFPILSLLLWLPIVGGMLVLVAGRVAPQAVRCKRNEPAYVAHTYAFLAELFGRDLTEQIAANAEAVFGL